MVLATIYEGIEQECAASGFSAFVASTGVDRTAGFRDTRTAAGIKVPASQIVHSGFDTGGGREAMRRLLAGRTRPTAVFAVNDFAAIGAMGASRDAGLQVGTDIAIIGFDDVPLAGSLPVGLSTIRSPMHDMGVQAVRLLTKRLAGEEVDSERLSPTLVARASTLGGESCS